VTEISRTAAAVLIPVIGSEFALGRAKLQSASARALAVWIVGYLAAACWLALHGGSGVIAFTIFWGGTFLLWFGVRSHIESSILLRMLFLLRQRPMTDARLLETYASVYGESMRLDELCRGRFIVKQRDTMRITPKGKAVLRVVSKLR
jgi:hypothetical protein